MMIITMTDDEILTLNSGTEKPYEFTPEERLKVLSAEIDQEMVPTNMFMECVNMTSVKFSEKVKIIGAGAFLKCSALSGHLNIPLGITKIGEFAFHNCPLLIGNLIIDDTCVHIGPSAFGGCAGLKGYLYYPRDCLAFHAWDKKKALGCHFTGTEMTLLRTEEITTLDEKIGYLIRQLVISENMDN